MQQDAHDDFDWEKKKLPRLNDKSATKSYAYHKGEMSTTHTYKTDSIDLHFEKLIDKKFQSQYSASDILNKQLQVLQRFISQSVNDKIYKITVIHGQGNGVLRQKIIALCKHHKHVKAFEDASFQKHGMYSALTLTLHKPN